MDRSNHPLKAFIIELDGEFIIVIDSSASIEEQTIMLAHELGHFFTNTLSEISTDNDVIKLNEMIADEFARKELGEDEK